jgi:hypothetical protein
LDFRTVWKAGIALRLALGRRPYIIAGEGEFMTKAIFGAVVIVLFAASLSTEAMAQTNSPLLELPPATPGIGIINSQLTICNPLRLTGQGFCTNPLSGIVNARDQQLFL